MNIEKELKEIELDTKKQEDMNNIFIAYDKRSELMTYAISDFIKSNRYIRNKIAAGSIKIENMGNELIVIYTDEFKSVKNLLDG